MSTRFMSKPCALAVMVALIVTFGEILLEHKLQEGLHASQVRQAHIARLVRDLLRIHSTHVVALRGVGSKILL